MSVVVSVHSFRGGTGKSNLTANVAASLARTGKRVAVIDTDIQSPGIHVLFGFADEIPAATLNSYLWGECSAVDAAVEVTDRVPGETSGAVYLVPSSMKAGDIARILRDGYDVELINEGIGTLTSALALDVVLIDTHPGLNEETLLSIAISDTLVVLLRPDHQDFQGTAVTVDVARRLGVPRQVAVVNKAYAGLDPADVRAKVEAAYDIPVIAVLPLAEEVAENASDHLFALTAPNHPWSLGIAAVTEALTEPSA